jgi:GGDEF domain-containing protein
MLYSHDGIHDSQTHLSSPPYFYEQLRKEMALSIRKNSPLALIKVIFDNPDSEQVRATDVLHFSHELSALTRKEDCVARMGVNEVVIIVPGGQSEVEPFLDRLMHAKSLTVNHTLQIRFARVLAEAQENELTVLERLEEAPLLSIGRQ